MKTNIKFLALLFILFYNTICFSNDKKKIAEILKKSSEYYSSKKQFEIKMTYNFFSNADSQKVTESYLGSIIKDNSYYYSKIGDTEIINGKGFSLKIDNVNKALQYYPHQLENNNTISDLKNYCSYFDRFYLTDRGNKWVCTMTTPGISFLPYSKLIIYINKSNYSISKQIAYFLTPNETRDKKGNTFLNYPRMEVEFSDLNGKINVDVFNLSNYLIIKKNKVYTSKKYSSYEIVE